MGRLLAFNPKRKRGVFGGLLLFLFGMACAFTLGWLVLEALQFGGDTRSREAVGAPDVIQPGAIQVIDGDTIRANGRVYRLIGFDTPETGGNAKCAAERALASRATARLRDIVARGQLQFRRVPCACQPGTEGTPRCNYGRLCGRLTAGGRDVGSILIAEGLARPYLCGTRCPPRQGWC